VVRILLNFFISLFLQAVLRALYAYFADRPLKEIPHIEVIWPVSFIFMVDYVLQFLLHVKLGQEGYKDLAPLLRYKNIILTRIFIQ
jgi:hypothetical protein